MNFPIYLIGKMFKINFIMLILIIYLIVYIKNLILLENIIEIIFLNIFYNGKKNNY